MASISDKAQQQARDVAREAEQIRRLLRQHGGYDYDPRSEEDRYEGGFEVESAKNGGSHHVGGFHIDPFGIWPPKMRQHAETLTAHGYHVKVLEYFDGHILEVTPPPRRSRGQWIRGLFRKIRTLGSR